MNTFYWVDISAFVCSQMKLFLANFLFDNAVHFIFMLETGKL
jgi:hypothetical protein